MSKNTDLFNKIVKSITKEGTPAINLKNFDLTFGITNGLIKTNIQLLMYLAKFSSVPITENYVKLANELGISQKQSELLQKVNKQTILLQSLAEKYCIQQYTLGSISHNMLDQVINNAAQIADSNTIQDFMDFIQHGQESQLGGAGNIQFKMLAFFIFLIICIASTNTGDSEVGIALINTDNKTPQPYNPKLMAIEPADFRKSVSQRDFSQSEEIDLTNAIILYDKKLQNTLSRQIMTIFSKQPDAMDIIKQYFDEFNQKSLEFSKQAEDSCKELMQIAYDKNIFKNWKSLDNIEETNEKLNEIREKAEEAAFERGTNMKNTLISIGLSTAVGDVAGIYSSVTSLFNTGIDALTSTSEVEKETREVMRASKQQSMALTLTASEKEVLNDKLHTFSNIYCSNSFNLQIGFNNGQIVVEGDKIDYKWMVQLIVVLEQNIQITASEIEKLNEDQKSKEISLSILESTRQRFIILKTMIMRLEEVVSFSSSTDLSKKLRRPTEKTLENIQDYFKNQLTDFNNILTQLKEKFPIDTANLRDEQSLMEEKRILQQEYNNIRMMDQQFQNNQSMFEANMNSAQRQADFEIFSTIVKSYVNFATNTLDLTGESFGNIAESGTNIVGSVVNGIFKGLTGTLSDMLYTLLTCPGGLFLVSVGFLALYVSIGGITGFVWAGKKFVCFIYRGFVFVFQVALSPFGYVLRYITTLFVKPNPNPRYNMSEEEAASALLALGHSGGRRKRRVTRRKGKKGKKRYTKRKHSYHKK